MAREADMQITREIGLPEVQKLEIDTVQNVQWKQSSIEIASISNNMSSHGIEKVRKEIQSELDKIDTKHDSIWEGYKVERWGLLGGVGAVACGTLIVKLVCRIKISRQKRQNSIECEQFELKNMKRQQQQNQHRQQQQHEQQQQHGFGFRCKVQ